MTALTAVAPDPNERVVPAPSVTVPVPEWVSRTRGVHPEPGVTTEGTSEPAT